MKVFQPQGMPIDYPRLLLEATGDNFVAMWSTLPPKRALKKAQQWLSEGVELVVPFQGHKRGKVRYNVGQLFFRRTPAVLKFFQAWAALHEQYTPWDGFYQALYDNPVAVRPVPAAWWEPETSPGIAVVIPCFAHEEFLPEAVQSAIDNRADQIIVVDDGSPGDVVQALRPFVSEAEGELPGSPIYVIQQENAGLPMARNVGINAATCEHIVSLDADDKLGEGVLDHMRGVIAVDNWVYTDVYLFGTAHKRVSVRVTPASMHAMQPAHPAVMYPKAAWSFVNGYDPTIKGFESWDFHARLIQAGYTPEKAKGLIQYRKQSSPSMLTGVLKNKEANMEGLRIRSPAYFGKGFGQ